MNLKQLKEKPFALILLISIILAVLTFIILSISFQCQYSICYRVPDTFDILTYFAGYAIILSIIYGIYKLIKGDFFPDEDEFDIEELNNSQNKKNS